MKEDFEKHIEKELKNHSKEEIEFAKRFFNKALKQISQPMSYKGFIKNNKTKAAEREK